MSAPLMVFSPFPPARNGIADYTALLLSGLGRHYDCYCILANDAPAPDQKMANAHYLYLDEYARTAEFAVERHLFQVGNNTGHAYMMRWLGIRRGVTTLHDASLAQLFKTLAPPGHMGPLYRNVCGANNDKELSLFLDAFAFLRLNDMVLGQEAPCLEAVARASRTVIVHSHLAQLRVMAAAPDVPVHVIPHFASIAGSSQVPLAENSVRLLCLGFTAHAKRVDLVVAATALLVKAGHDVKLVIAGESSVRDYDIEVDIDALGLGEIVSLLGYIDESRIEMEIAACDIFVNLRYPTSGETSGALMRGLSAGKCCVVTDIGAYAELPDDCVVKVAASEMTPAGLAQRLWQTVASKPRRVGIGERARSFIGQVASLDLVASRYARVIEESYRVDVATPPQGPRRFLFPTRNPVAPSRGSEDHFPLWWNTHAVPLPNVRGRLLLVGGTRTDKERAETLSGWSEVVWRPLTSYDLDDLVVGQVGNDFDSAIVLVSGEHYSDSTNALSLIESAGASVNRGGTMTVELSLAPPERQPVINGITAAGFKLIRHRTNAHLPISLPSMQVSADQWCGTFVSLAGC